MHATHFTLHIDPLSEPNYWVEVELIRNILAAANPENRPTDLTDDIVFFKDSWELWSLNKAMR